MNKIVLYGPRPDPTQRYLCAPLPLLCISSPLVNKGYDIKIISWSDEDLEGGVLGECADALCLGITAMTGYQITDGLRIARMVKEKFPKIPVAWGGWHPSLLAEQTLKNPYVDIIVKGQGERTFTELVEALAKDSDFSKIQGLVYKRGNQVFHNPDRPLEDINNFPPLPYELLNMSQYIFEHRYLGPRTMHYMTSYGCPHRCGFCSNLSVIGRRWFGLSAERVLNDVERFVNRYNIAGLVIVDMNFFVNKERVRQICKGVLERGIHIKWGEINGRTRELAAFDDELWDLMEAAGFRHLLVGSESGYQESLDLIDKDASVEDAFKFTKKCHQHNMKVMFSNMAGLPFNETNASKRALKIDEDIKATIEMIDKINEFDPRHRFLLIPYAPFPGTLLYQKALKLGFRPPADLESWGSYDMQKARTPWVTKRQARLIGMLQYIFLFIDPDSAKILANVKNRFAKFGGLLLLKFFRFLAQKRWERKYFNLPFDYWLYWFIRRNQRWV